LNVKSNPDEKVESIKIINAAGQIVMNKTFSTDKTATDVSDLASGYYIVKIQTSKGIVKKKILVE